MAVHVASRPVPSVSAAVSLPRNSSNAGGAAEQRDFYDQILRLRDAVLAGTHPHIRLSEVGLTRLRAASATSPVVREKPLSFDESSSNASSEDRQKTDGLFPKSTADVRDDRGVSAHAAKAALKEFDPILLQKPEALVRAESRLKRQRIERELHSQAEQRRNFARDKDQGLEGASRFDIDEVLRLALERVPLVSGLQPVVKSSHQKSISLNTDDYYSSRHPSVESHASTLSSGSGPDYEKDLRKYKDRLRSPASHAQPESANSVIDLSGTILARDAGDLTGEQRDDADEDDDYVPPGPEAFDSFHERGVTGVPGPNAMAEVDDADDESEYEPEEMTQESAFNTPQLNGKHHQPTNATAVPVIRNHLTHIVAPQPSRVSPLAIANGPSVAINLENGHSRVAQGSFAPAAHTLAGEISRGSTTSPTANMRSGNKKRRNKKRKRDVEPPKPGPPKVTKRRKEKAQEPRVKDEPISPPPYGALQPAIQLTQGGIEHGAALAGGLAYPPQITPNNNVRPNAFADYTPSSSPRVARAASASLFRPVQRDTSNLRRVATLQHALQPVSDSRMPYALGEPTRSARYDEYNPSQPSMMLEGMESARRREPRDVQQQHDPPQRQQSRVDVRPAPNPEFVVDQYGNRFYAANDHLNRPSPHPNFVSEPSAGRFVVPPPQPAHVHYASQPQDLNAVQTAPLKYVEYVNMNGERFRTYDPPELPPSAHYSSYRAPSYQISQSQANMAPPPPPPPITPHESSYGAPHRPQSMYVDERSNGLQAYHQQPSVAPVQYIRHDVPPSRSMSVMPPSAHVSREYSLAPTVPNVKYVDQYGREVYPQEVRQVSEYRY